MGRLGGKTKTKMGDEYLRKCVSFFVLSWVKVIDVPFLVEKMTDGLKDSISLSLTSALLMEAVSFVFGNAETQATRHERSC